MIGENVNANHGSVRDQGRGHGGYPACLGGFVMDRAPLADPRRGDGLWVIGHRGAAGLAPENTLASFAHAVGLGVDAVELDVHLSADGHLVVIHDERIDRTTNGNGKVADAPLAALRMLDAGAGERVPTLDEVLEAVPRHIAINIELKGPGTAAPVARAVAAYKRPLLVSAFDHSELARFHSLRPSIPCAPLLGRWRHAVLDTARTLGAWSINLADRVAEHLAAQP